jgi:integrase/recombinase XerD
MAHVQAKRRRRVFPGDPADPAGFRSLAADFVESMQVAGLTPATIASYERSLLYFAEWAIDRGITRPVDVTRPVIERYQRHLFHYRKPSGDPITFGSQQQRLIAVQKYFRWLTRQRHVLFNPATDLEIPRVRRRLPKDVLTPLETELVLAQPDLATHEGLQDRAILETFYSSGIRRTELANLRLWDLDREHGTLFIRLGKGRKDRIVPIGARAIAWIDRYVAQARPEWAPSPDHGGIFLTPAGKPARPDGLTSMTRSYIEAAGVKKRGACHIFRHTMATAMLENGADIRFIQQMLGHESLETTQIYTRVAIGQLTAVHRATHPAGQPPSAGGPKAGARPFDATRQAFLDELAAEAAEEGDA